MSKYGYNDVDVYRTGRARRAFFKLVIFVLILVGIYQYFKILPDNISLSGITHQIPSSSVIFLADETYLNSEGERESTQTIFDTVFTMIREAKSYVLIDMFLFNDFQGHVREDHRALSSELVTTIVEKRKRSPNINIIIVTDPINTMYGGFDSAQIQTLRDNATVIITDLKPLRDSNPLYSTPWRVFASWWDNSAEGGYFPNPLITDGPKVTLRTWLSLLNFKANHRKLIVADRETRAGTEIQTLITSGNPHDGSSAHSNVALLITEKIWQDVIRSESATLDLNQQVLDRPQVTDLVDRMGSVNVTLYTEAAIKENYLDVIQATQPGDTIDMMMFYLSERTIINALIEAAVRGVSVRLILDPNKDAFGREKNGVPNRPVAKLLLKKSEGKIHIRWCDTHGEQCHSKMMLATIGDTHHILLGSANVTRRNIGNYNLETNVHVSAETEINAIKDARTFFNRAWHNEYNRIYTTDYETYRDDTLYKTALYYLMEYTGLSTF